METNADHVSGGQQAIAKFDICPADDRSGYSHHFGGFCQIIQLVSFILSEPVEIDLLQPNDVGFRLPNHSCNTLGIAPAVCADTLMNIVGNGREQNLLPIFRLRYAQVWSNTTDKKSSPEPQSRPLAPQEG
jgi:hypothetical protein